MQFNFILFHMHDINILLSKLPYSSFITGRFDITLPIKYFIKENEFIQFDFILCHMHDINILLRKLPYSSFITGRFDITLPIKYFIK